MSNYRRLYANGGTYFFTVITYRRQRFLCDEPCRRWLREAIHYTRQRYPFKRGVGQVKVFRQRLKDELRHYAIHLADAMRLSTVDRKLFTEQHDHRTLKQVCNIEHFQVRGKTLILNHLFAVICGYVHLQKFCALDVIANCYRLQRELFQEAIASFIDEFVDNAHLNPQFFKAVNA